MKGLAVFVGLGLGLVACGGSKSSPSHSVAAAPEPTCDDVAAYIGDKIEARPGQTPETGQSVADRFRKRCREDGWTLESRQCFSGAPALQRCLLQLTKAQLDALDADRPPSALLLPQNVGPQALDANRTAGEKNITPDNDTRTEISQSGKDKLVGSYKVCVTAEGNIKTVTRLKSTGFPAYDQKIINTIRNEWRYRPFTVNGEATPVCTAVMFIYSQPVLPPPPAAPQSSP